MFTLPEVPTMFTQAGTNYLTTNKDFFFEGEKATLEIQLALEDKFQRMAEACTEPCVIICDRGTLDISAYMSAEMWDTITGSVGVDTASLRSRYDAVLHLVSAADGAEQFYTTSNNAQRLEKADEAGLKIARELDKKVIKAWSGHPHLRVINNNEDFDRKLNRSPSRKNENTLLSSPAMCPTASKATSPRHIWLPTPTAKCACAAAAGTENM